MKSVNVKSIALKKLELTKNQKRIRNAMILGFIGVLLDPVFSILSDFFLYSLFDAIVVQNNPVSLTKLFCTYSFIALCLDLLMHED